MSEATAVTFLSRLRGRPLSPINQRRWRNFKSNKRGYWSLWIFSILFILSLFAEFIANDRPILLTYKGDVYFPVLAAYPETTFGGEFETTADYRDPFVQDLIRRRPPTTGSARMIRVATWRRGSYTASGSLFCSD